MNKNFVLFLAATGLLALIPTESKEGLVQSPNEGRRNPWYSCRFWGA